MDKQELKQALRKMLQVELEAMQYYQQASRYMKDEGAIYHFNLLAQDPANRVPLSWEVEWPTPPPEPATYQRDPRIRDAEKLYRNLDRLIPHLSTIHEVGARLPQECVAINVHEFTSVFFHTMFHVPSYQGWLDRQSLLPCYRFHRSFLQHLQSRYRKRRWVFGRDSRAR